jgi:hypothetical protein
MVVTVKNAIFWDIKIQSIPHRRQYVSATELSPLMLCKIFAFLGGVYEKYHLLGCYAM